MSEYCPRFVVYLRSLALGLAAAGAAGPLYAGVSTPKTAAMVPFTAETAAAAKRQGMVSAGGLNWRCQGSRCTTSGTPTLLSIGSCQAVAREVGQIRSFASGKHALSAAELSQCNAAVSTGPAARIGTPTPAPAAGLTSVPNPSAATGGAPAETSSPERAQAPRTPVLPSPAPPEGLKLLPRSDAAKFPLMSAILLRINGSAGPVVNVPEVDPVRANWEGSRAFVEPLGETLIEHWLVVSDGRRLSVNSCEVADESSLPDARGIDGDGRSVSSSTGSDLGGLVAGHTYYVKLCMKTWRPGATPQDAWRHESQQVTLNYGESALAPSGGLGPRVGITPVVPSPSGAAALGLLGFSREVAPDLVVREITLSRDPDGGAGQLVIQFKDDRGREHFRTLYDDQRAARVRASLAAGPEDIYPFRYAVYVDGALIPQAGGQSYLPRSGSQLVTTERYWLPGDGRSHQVRVVATPVFTDYNPENNERTMDLVVETRRDASFSLTAEALGGSFAVDTPGYPFPSTSYPRGHTVLIAAPGIDVGGYFYAVKSTVGPIPSGGCVASSGVNVTVAGTIGSTPLRSVVVEYGLDTAIRQERTFDGRGRTMIDGVWHVAGAPYEILNVSFTLDMQPVVMGNDRLVPVRATVTEVDGRVYIKELAFILAGYYFTPVSDFVSITVDEVKSTVAGLSSTASRGASTITIDGRRQWLTLNGRVRLNPNNCLLRDTRIEGLQLGYNRAAGAFRYGMTIGVSNVLGVTRTGAETTFRGDFNIRNGLTEDPGSYELVLGFSFNNLTPASRGNEPAYSSSPRMIVTVR